MQINKIEIYKIWLPFVTPQPSWNGVITGRDVILLRAQGPGSEAWSELGALPDPTYVSEFIDSELMVLMRYLIPGSIGVKWSHPDQYFDWLEGQVVGHGFAKCALDCLGWALHAQDNGQGLLSALNTKRNDVQSGVVLGVNDWSPGCLKWILESGYTRIKFKLTPDTSVETLKQIRAMLPSQCLMVGDGNGRLPLDMVRRVSFLDWVEEPFMPGDWVAYQSAVSQLAVPVVLDESIRTPLDAVNAAHLGCAMGVSLKPSRLGGITPTRRLIARLSDAGIRVGIGGMYETGVGRYYNLALDATIQTPLVGDFSPDSRYWGLQLLVNPIKFESGLFQLVDSVPIVDRFILDQKFDTIVASFG